MESIFYIGRKKMIPDLNEFNQLSNKVYDIDQLKGSNG